MRLFTSALDMLIGGSSVEATMLTGRSDEIESRRPRAVPTERPQPLLTPRAAHADVSGDDPPSSDRSEAALEKSEVRERDKAQRAVAAAPS